ncbi:MAG: hypothetical protein JJE42_04530 [Burkholderiales bacterium]|nr:hypothetical protein [Burkholderiales bacterium]
MRIEAHVHGTIRLRPETTLSQIETALRPWLRYIDEDGLADARSVYEDEPGLSFDAKERTLEICWTGDVGRGFRELIEEALQALCPYTDSAAEIEVSYYHDDGQDEFGMVFVGPTPESIHERQKSRMIDDVSGMLARHFTEAEIGEVAALVNQLFDRNWTEKTGSAKSGSSAAPRGLTPAQRRRLH